MLDQMGVQRWRLRQPTGSVVEPTSSQSDVPVKPLAAKPPSAPPVEVANHTRSDRSISENNKGKLDEKLTWQDLETLFAADVRCESCQLLHSILGEGNRNADWVFVVDAPSRRDVAGQKLLSGREGQLFDAILHALNLERAAVYLSSVFKCPPSADRAVLVQCGDLIHQQIELINPTVVLAFGEFTSQALLRSNHDLDDLRSTENHTAGKKIAVISTYGLREMLDEPGLKAAVWQDLKKGLQLL